MTLVHILPAAPLPHAYTYRWPFPDAPQAGQYVTVPLHGRKAPGVVWQTGVPAPEKGTLKDVLAVHPLPPLPAALRTFLEWVADYTLSPLGAVLKLTLSVNQVFTETPARGKKMPFVWPDATSGNAPALSLEQQQAADILRRNIGNFQPLVLDGVTGSGKTEVYSEAVAACLAAGKQAVVMLPEIALSTAMLARFEKRFGITPALWHSGITPAVRRETWKGIAEGRVPLVIGARSALFLPYANPGLIVVDEEHDSSYKQEDGVFYHARDMAVVRARQEQCPVILVSATPSLETMGNIDNGRYVAVHLPERHGSAILPDVTLVDMRKETLPKGEWLSPTIRQAITDTLHKQQQVLLFLNRRGYAPLTLCQSCGHRFQCPQCTAWLVSHKNNARLQCHHCGYRAPLPKECPACKSPDTLVACGPGVERIAEEATRLFPQARLAILSSDTMDTPSKAADVIAQVHNHEIDILVGTQVMAKGHHFPALTLVAVLDADVGLSGGDVRAAEKTWQLLHQVAGRAGRGEWHGKVLLQTFTPDHTVMQTLAKHDRNAFLAAQKMEREITSFPPYGRLAALIISSPKPELAHLACQQLAAKAPMVPDVDILGPAPAPLALLHGQHRWRFLIRTPRTFALQKMLRYWLEGVKIQGDVKVKVDIDPYSFL